MFKYIGRYLGRPVIATSRIDKYDGSMVTFHYNRHEDELLDMDYFLNEDDLFADEAGVEGFYIF